MKIKNPRLEEIAKMYSSITGESISVSKKAILGTRVGKAIAQNNPVFLYEQPTNNLRDIAQELKAPLQRKFSDEAISQSYLKIKRPISKAKARIIITACPELKSSFQASLKSQNDARLRIMQHQKNLISERNCKNGD